MQSYKFIINLPNKILKKNKKILRCFFNQKIWNIEMKLLSYACTRACVRAYAGYY